MTFILSTTLTHKSFEAPVKKEIRFVGNSYDDILDQIGKFDAPRHHIENLRHYRKTKFYDTRGVAHSWVLREDKTIN